MPQPARGGGGSFLLGLFLTTLVALAVEMLDTRLLSVLTWYHLSFFAVSIAMFGMSAGAVVVYLGGERFRAEKARDTLCRATFWFAVSLPVTHVANICIPLRTPLPATTIAALFVSTVILAIPFFLAGVVVSVALTRIPGSIGVIYAVDLLGAALGALLVVPLLQFLDITSAVILLAGIALLGAFFFARFAGRRRLHLPLLALLLFAGAFLNSRYPDRGLRLPFTKGKQIDWHLVTEEAWNVHSHIVAYDPREGKPFTWGASPTMPDLTATTVKMQIDGSAGTFLTRWDGTQEGLDWVRYDVTSLPYHLRKGGDVAVIGVGGGRDILTALWGAASSVTGIEINSAFVDLLQGPFRDFAGIASRKDVSLVHDEARSYLTRAQGKFDIIQMSLIDTWAATGAGAFTLTENGLYTLEGWRAFLEGLRPGGIFSVTRWYTPEEVHETGRLLSLAVTSLLQRQVTRPADHLALVACGNVATLILSPQPLTADDRTALDAAVKEYDFRVLAAPGHPAASPLLATILNATTVAGLEESVKNEPYDYSAPTDERPYFFNSLKLGTIQDLGIKKSLGVIARGNLMATGTLFVLFVIAVVLVLVIILRPLAAAGLPAMDLTSFLACVLYFASIGMGFMMVQIGLMQRFSVYLGHPTYAVAVILFSMILFTGIGSFLSDKIHAVKSLFWIFLLPLLAAGLLTFGLLKLGELTESTVHLGLLARCGVVIAVTAPVSVVLGFFFPIGMRLTSRLSPDATAWMWGINGACGVLAGVLAIAISMWAGIRVSLGVGAALYLGLILWAGIMRWKGARRPDPETDNAPDPG